MCVAICRFPPLFEFYRLLFFFLLYCDRFDVMYIFVRLYWLQYAGHARSVLLSCGGNSNMAPKIITQQLTFLPFCVWVPVGVYVLFCFFSFLFRSTDRIELPINERTRHSRAPPVTHEHIFLPFPPHQHFEIKKHALQNMFTA